MSEPDIIVSKLRLYASSKGGMTPTVVLNADLMQAADEIERLRELLGNAEQLRVDRSEMVKMANMLRNGTHRVYMVRANDYSRGTVMPVRIATAKTLSAMIDRCAEDCYGKDAKQVGTGSWDLSVIVTVGELEVQSE